MRRAVRVFGLWRSRLGGESPRSYPFVPNLFFVRHPLSRLEAVVEQEVAAARAGGGWRWCHHPKGHVLGRSNIGIRGLPFQIRIPIIDRRIDCPDGRVKTRWQGILQSSR